MKTFTNSETLSRKYAGQFNIKPSGVKFQPIQRVETAELFFTDLRGWARRILKLDR
jgi:hypothetical protein